MNRKQGFLTQQTTVVLLFLVAVFVDVLTTKIVMLFTPGSTVEAEASRINNYFFVALGVLLLLALWKTPLRIRWAALKTGGRDIFRREMLEAAGISLLLIIVMVVYRLILNGLVLSLQYRTSGAADQSAGAGECPLPRPERQPAYDRRPDRAVLRDSAYELSAVLSGGSRPALLRDRLSV